MKTIKKVPVTFEYVEFMPPYEEMKEGVVYISNMYKVAVHRCLCGCGSKTVTPLGPDGWLYTVRNGLLDMTPSIGNFQMPCSSHYIITRGIANFV